MAVDPPAPGSALPSLIEGTGRKARAVVAEVGYASRLIASSLYWCIAGWRHGQPVRPQLVLTQMQEIGLSAIPIVAVMAATIGAMLAIQTIYSLRLRRRVPGHLRRRLFRHAGVRAVDYGHRRVRPNQLRARRTRRHDDDQSGSGCAS